MKRPEAAQRFICTAHGREWIEVGPWLYGAVCPDPEACKAAESVAAGGSWSGASRRVRGRRAVGVLTRLKRATVEWHWAQIQREALIAQALNERHSERAIGRAAGISGPAVHQRKRSVPAEGKQTS